MEIQYGLQFCLFWRVVTTCDFLMGVTLEKHNQQLIY